MTAAVELPEPLVSAIVSWASSQELVRRAYVFGSYAKGTQRSDSDLDVAIELDTVDSDVLGAFILNLKEWTEELSRLTGYEVDLDLFHSDEAPTVHEYVTEAPSVIVYEKTQSPASWPK